MSYDVTMHRESKPRCGLPLGGLGAGWFELRQDGATARWNIFNNKPIGWGPNFPFIEHSMLFFIARWQYPGEEPRMKLFQIEESHNVAALSNHEIQYIFPWLTGVDSIEYSASFPFATLKFRADDMPFEADLTAWSPFIPFDEKNSALPGAFFDFTLRSTSKKPLKITLAAHMRNGAGFDIEDRFYTARMTGGKGWRGFEASCGNVDETHITYGASGITSLSADSKRFLGWGHPHHYHERFIMEDSYPEENNTTNCNKTDEKTGKQTAYSEYCWNAVAVERKLKKRGDEFKHTFVVSWRFPNNYGRNPEDGLTRDRAKAKPGEQNEGHYYNNFFANSAEAGAYLVKHRKDLLRRTRAFHASFFDSSAPGYVLDQVNANLSTFFTSSWFTESGHFGIMEGLSPTISYAGLSTTDVAMFGSPMYAALFPKLSRQVNRDYARLQYDNGVIAHSITYNFDTLLPAEAEGTRLDLPAQFTFLTLRDFFWSNDSDYLEELYDNCRKAMEYVLRERDMNKDGLPDMEGVMCSYDNFPMYGIAAFVAGQFILALKAMSLAARRLGKTDDAERYETLFESGSRLFEEKLWNGEYYRLSNDEDGEHGADEGCLSDQIIAQWAAHQVGLGHLFDPKHTRKALKGILKHNFRDWQGLRNCQWPEDRFMHKVEENIWVDQANTCWTGVELEFSALLMYEGLVKEGLKVLKTCDDRHRKSGMYFDHQEFGGHYFRPMSVWSNLNALLGLHIQAGTYTFAPAMKDKNQRLFFAAPDGWGHYQRTVTKKKETIRLEVEHGALPIRQLQFTLLDHPRSVEVTVNGRPARQIATDGKTLAIAITGKRPVREVIVHRHG